MRIDGGMPMERHWISFGAINSKSD